ncbi:MAG TPA: prepilin peptidase [Patescibacteria group bacterium]|jgi:leader peptidase (prepilin peptidase)/N-methyltransferase
MTTVLFFILGLIFGSFLSTVFHRLEIEGLGTERRRKKAAKAKEGLVSGRSRCDRCKTQIPWYHNVPLVSFLLLRGKCHHCGKPISEYHPTLELTSGLVLAVSYLAYGWSWQLLVAGFFGLVMVFLLAYDLRHQIIPNVVVIPAIAFALVMVLAQALLFNQGIPVQVGLWSSDPDTYLLGGGAAGLFFLALSVASGGKWIGGGDIKLGVLIGLVVGWPAVLVALIMAYVVGMLYAVVLLLTRQATLKSSVPFGPMLAIGYFVAAFYADAIISWYQGLVL